MIEFELLKIGVGTFEDPFRPDWTNYEQHESNLVEIEEKGTIFIVKVTD
ncbi:MAG: hypothetical protein KAV87_63340 [Desulfobacteraceae bacterium]|nr:hypothetical protein [Desulfobacteraceae bacterium]